MIPGIPKPKNQKFWCLGTGEDWCSFSNKWHSLFHFCPRKTPKGTNDIQWYCGGGWSLLTSYSVSHIILPYFKISLFPTTQAYKCANVLYILHALISEASCSRQELTKRFTTGKCAGVFFFFLVKYRLLNIRLLFTLKFQIKYWQCCMAHTQCLVSIC